MISSTYLAFTTVARLNSFHAAAKMLHLTPSAISHSIAKLEDELNLTLFIRDKKGAHLTFVGEQLLVYAENIINNEETLFQNAAQLSGSESGTVIIGTSNSMCQHWLPEIISTFTKLYPNINIIVYQGGYQDTASWLDSGYIDIGFLPKPLTKPFDTIDLHKERLICVMPYGFIPKDGMNVGVEDIKDLVLVNQSNMNNIDTNILIEKHNLKYDSLFSISDDQSLIAIVESGLGFCIMPELVVKNTQAKVAIYPFKPSEYRTICLVKSKRNNTLPSTIKMYNHIEEYISKNGLRNV